MKNLRNILVGIDYSHPSTSALREAHRCARWDGANLIALHVIDEEILDDLRQEIEFDPQAAIDAADRRLEIHLDKVLGNDHGTIPKVIIGHPFEALMLTAQEQEADLIVLGSHGRKERDPEPDRIGILAARCVRRSEQNVLLLREAQDRPFQHIIACIDFSETSRKAATLAFHVALQDEATVEFLHVYRPASAVAADADFYTGVAPPILPSDDDSSQGEKLKAKLETLVRQLTTELGDIPYKLTVIDSLKRRPAIIKHIDESGADLVVAGTRGRSALQNLFLGSTTVAILDEAACSVLAVKPHGFEYSCE